MRDGGNFWRLARLTSIARVDGKDVFFLTGTDEHGQKMIQTAASEGTSAAGERCLEVANLSRQGRLSQANIARQLGAAAPVSCCWTATSPRMDHAAWNLDSFQDGSPAFMRSLHPLGGYSNCLSLSLRSGCHVVSLGPRKAEPMWARSTRFLAAAWTGRTGVPCNVASWTDSKDLARSCDAKAPLLHR